MKFGIALVVLLASVVSLSAQRFDPGIESLINSVSQDSLMSYVRILSGEDSVVVNGAKQLIDQRVYNSNDLAADYLVEKLESFGLSPAKLNYAPEGTNVVAYQTGSEYPNEYYIICAHYDGVTYYCADDNATGTATVLEAARILSQEEFPYSIAYALWDEEEIGLIGSHDFAKEAANIGLDIGGVINIDMIGWDSNDDGLVEIHANQDIASGAIVNIMQQVNSDYSLGLAPTIKNPGTGASDHASFWDYNYGAVLLIEGYWSGDFNPYYHSVNDRVDKFNVPYFHRAAQLAIGATAELATQDQYVSIPSMEVQQAVISLLNYPNPFLGQTTIEYELQETASVQVDIISPFGQLVCTVESGTKEKGTHTITFDSNGLPGGMYALVLWSDFGRSVRNILILE